ncbi:MAG: hypothetical protein J6N93_01495 [Clostridia bacterium]|nr:hypothetical protein [Clostridia bacterium]
MIKEQKANGAHSGDGGKSENGGITLTVVGDVKRKIVNGQMVRKSIFS